MELNTKKKINQTKNISNKHTRLMCDEGSASAVRLNDY